MKTILSLCGACVILVSAGNDCYQEFMQAREARESSNKQDDQSVCENVRWVEAYDENGNVIGRGAECDYDTQDLDRYNGLKKKGGSE